jgi:predicted nuclease with TOPRIM domain
MQENARLMAEVERVVGENSHLQGGIYSLSLNVVQLKDEVERLTERNQHLEQIDSYLQDGINIANEERCIQLEAQVERLTKAGDELWEFAKLADTNAPKARRKALKDWLAAKGGKQP